MMDAKGAGGRTKTKTRSLAVGVVVLNVYNETTELLSELIEQEFCPSGDVKITQQYADVFRCDE